VHALSPLSEGWWWMMQGRAWAQNGDNYARSYSNPVKITEDRDGDGISDVEEMALGTDPLAPDTDGDMVGDGLELSLGTEPLDAGDPPGGALPSGATDVEGTWEYRNDSGALRATFLFNPDGSFVIDHQDYRGSETWYHEEGAWELTPEGLQLTWSSSDDPSIPVGTTRTVPVVLLPDDRMVLDLWILLQRVP